MSISVLCSELCLGLIVKATITLKQKGATWDKHWWIFIYLWLKNKGNKMSIYSLDISYQMCVQCPTCVGWDMWLLGKKTKCYIENIGLLIKVFVKNDTCGSNLTSRFCKDAADPIYKRYLTTYETRIVLGLGMYKCQIRIVSNISNYWCCRVCIVSSVLVYVHVYVLVCAS